MYPNSVVLFSHVGVQLGPGTGHSCPYKTMLQCYSQLSYIFWRTLEGKNGHIFLQVSKLEILSWPWWMLGCVNPEEQWCLCLSRQSTSSTESVISLCLCSDSKQSLIIKDFGMPVEVFSPHSRLELSLRILCICAQNSGSLSNSFHTECSLLLPSSRYAWFSSDPKNGVDIRISAIQSPFQLPVWLGVSLRTKMEHTCMCTCMHIHMLTCMCSHARICMLTSTWAQHTHGKTRGSVPLLLSRLQILTYHPSFRFFLLQKLWLLSAFWQDFSIVVHRSIR